MVGVRCNLPWLMSKASAQYTKQYTTNLPYTTLTKQLYTTLAHHTTVKHSKSNPVRYLASTSDPVDGVTWKSVRLTNRSLISVEGDEAAAFLQGLMTNDINVLETQDNPSIYCAFLNTGGRILFDTIISNGFKPNQFIIEVDSGLAKAAVKHLNMYKVRRKLKIAPMPGLSVFSLFHNGLEVNQSSHLTTRSSVIGATFCDGGSRDSLLAAELTSISDPNSRCFVDPRLDLLGYRYIGPEDQAPIHKFDMEIEEASLEHYTRQRCWIGVAEGSTEIPPSKCFPLEYNLDYLHGVSFHKGCYLGQELTARTHYTGVIRKRILPLFFNSYDPSPVLDSNVTSEAGRSVGKLRQATGPFGLALIRLKEAFAAESLSCEGETLSIWKPVWWPPEKTDDTKKHTI